jgi:hypothetical protein
MRKMKFYLAAEYEVPDTKIAADTVKQAHVDVFEQDPKKFIGFLFNKKNVNLEYEFEYGEEQEEFKCDGYYYHHTYDKSNICNKYGALCSNSFCNNLPE